MWYNLSLIVGIILLIISLVIFKRSLTFLQTSERAIGTVIEIETIRDSDGNTFKPVFKFKTNLNEEIIYKSPFSSNPSNWKIGEEATLAYDRGNPSSARLLTYFGTFSWTIVLMAVSLPLIVIGGGYHVSHYFLK